MKDAIESMIDGCFLVEPLKERFLDIFRTRMKALFG
jgi:hypothetical protein